VDCERDAGDVAKRGFKAAIMRKDVEKWRDKKGHYWRWTTHTATLFIEGSLHISSSGLR
jgi:hypothetical protein